MKPLFLSALLAGASFAVLPAQARIQLDYEVDPLPLVEITVVLPVGFEAKVEEDAGAANLLGDLLEGGTAKMNRQQLVDAYGRFGASADFSVSNQHSFLKLSFPVVEGRDYEGLADLVAENWKTPRFDEENFRLARLKLEAALRGSLDSDMSLGSTAARRWANVRFFGGFPVTLDNLEKLDLAKTRAVWERDFLTVKDVWVGVVAPESSRPFVKSLLSKVFDKQGDIRDTPKPSPLEVREAKAKGLKEGSKTFFIIDKLGRNQAVVSVISMTGGKLDDDEEIAFQFANHILVDSGLGSVFGEEIRTRRGLAYSVGGVHRFYLGHPSLGLAANPVRPRADEALGVVAGLLKDSFVTGEVFEKLPEDAWKRQWQSFTYGKVLEMSTPGGRLAERMSVVTGGLSRKTYQSDPMDWKVSRKQAAESVRSIWKKSALLASVLGDSKELRPLVQKHFPDWEIVVIPYADTLRSATYRP
jgi:predicted Zn-dependent peptidase